MHAACMGHAPELRACLPCHACSMRHEALNTTCMHACTPAGCSLLATQALEHAFKNETIGLVTKADFVKKRTTLQDR